MKFCTAANTVKVIYSIDTVLAELLVYRMFNGKTGASIRKANQKFINKSFGLRIIVINYR
jgi:hypothetical protein